MNMIKGRLELDDVDRKIAALLEANPRIYQGEIAKHVLSKLSIFPERNGDYGKV